MGLTIWDIFYLIFQYVIFLYFIIISISYAVLAYLGVTEIVRYHNQLSETSLKNLLEQDFYVPISVLVPAYNEEKTIVASVQSLLSLHYPALEVIVVSDGSEDQTVQKLIEAYQLNESRYIYETAIETQSVHRILRSDQYPNLVVIEKKNGGKADALNAAINIARSPLVCAVDADSLLDAEALLRGARLFLHDEQLVALGAAIRPLNGATIQNGTIQTLALPDSWVERFQIVEYSRAFFAGRAGWAAINALLVVSGAFGIFRRDLLLQIGGYATDTVTEDIELIVRIHRYLHEQKRPYRIRFIPDPICWTEVPSDLASLRQQRNRWHRGLLETLLRHRQMVFNRRYGAIGMIALPYFWLFEAFSPFIELGGYVMIIVFAAAGLLSFELWAWFLLLAIIYAWLISQIALGNVTLLLQRYDQFRDRLLFSVLGLMELFGYRQILLWERFKAGFQIWHKQGEWGKAVRKGFS